MARFIDQPPKNDSRPGKNSLTARAQSGQNLAMPLAQRVGVAGKKVGAIPNASIIYGCAAAVLLVISLYMMFKLANWFVGLLVLVLAGTLLGYALYFMRYR
jgi:hypothetical protein